MQPPPGGPQETCIVHDAVPASAVEVGTEIVAVLGDEQTIADELSSPCGYLAVHVEQTVAAEHVGDVDSPPIEPFCEPAREHLLHSAAQLRCAPVARRQRGDAEPARLAERQRPVEV